MTSATSNGQEPAPGGAPAPAHEPQNDTHVTDNAGEPPLKKAKLDEPFTLNGDKPPRRKGVAPIKAEYVQCDKSLVEVANQYLSLDTLSISTPFPYLRQRKIQTMPPKRRITRSAKTTRRRSQRSEARIRIELLEGTRMRRDSAPAEYLRLSSPLENADSATSAASSTTCAPI